MIDAREARIAAEASGMINDARDYSERVTEMKTQTWLQAQQREIEKLMRPVYDKIADAAGLGCTYCWIEIGDSNYSDINNMDIDIRKYYHESPIAQLFYDTYMSLLPLRRRIANIISSQVQEHGYKTIVNEGNDYYTARSSVRISW